MTVASVARVAPGGPKAVGGSLASFLPRLPILPYVGDDGEWDERHKPGHNGQFGPGSGLKRYRRHGLSPFPRHGFSVVVVVVVPDDGRVVVVVDGRVVVVVVGGCVVVVVILLDVVVVDVVVLLGGSVVVVGSVDVVVVDGREVVVVDGGLETQRKGSVALNGTRWGCLLSHIAKFGSNKMRVKGALNKPGGRVQTGTHCATLLQY